MARVDRRILRTTKSLKRALISLTLEKDYDDITIQEITDRADIGYRTFFRHYPDKDSLLEDVLSSTMMDLREIMSPPSPEVLVDPNFSAAEFTQGVVLFQHVKENSDLYRVLLRSDRTVIESLLEFATKETEADLRRVVKDGVSIEILANHMTWTIMALVRWWLDNDMPYSVEEMGEYSFRLVVKPVREMILELLSIPE